VTEQDSRVACSVSMIPWLDSCEDVSRYLRGSIGHAPPTELKSEPLIELQSLVICAFLIAILIVAVMHLRQGRLAIGNRAIKGPIQEWRLKRRIRAFAKGPRERANKDVVQNESAWNCRQAFGAVRQILALSSRTGRQLRTAHVHREPKETSVR